MTEKKYTLVMNQSMTWDEILKKLDENLEKLEVFAANSEKKMNLPQNWMHLLHHALLNHYTDGMLHLGLRHADFSIEGSPYEGALLQFRVSSPFISLTLHTQSQEFTKQKIIPVGNLNPVGKAKLFWSLIQIFSPGALKALSLSENDKRSHLTQLSQMSRA